MTLFRWCCLGVIGFLVGPWFADRKAVRRPAHPDHMVVSIKLFDKTEGDAVVMIAAIGLCGALLEPSPTLPMPFTMASLFQPEPRLWFQNSAVPGSNLTPFSATPKRQHQTCSGRVEGLGLGLRGTANFRFQARMLLGFPRHRKFTGVMIGKSV